MVEIPSLFIVVKSHDSVVKMSFVDSETVATITEECNNLVCCCNTCVDVCFRGLCAHFLWCEEYTVAKFGFQSVGAVGLDVSDIFDVLAFAKDLGESFFVDDFFTSGVDKHAVFWKKFD